MAVTASDSLRVLRIASVIEGATLLLLFLVAMPLKYVGGDPRLVPPAGWVHGLAFVAYLIAMVPALRGRRVGVSGWLRTFAAALVPFGTFANDRWVRRQSAIRLRA